MITNVDIAVVSIIAFKEIKINLPGTAWFFPFYFLILAQKLTFLFMEQIKAS